MANYSNKISEAKKAVEQFERAQNALREFIADHQGVFDAFFDISESYNGLLNEAKVSVRNVEDNDRITLGPFSRSKRPVTTEYDATSIDPAVLAIPGVVTKIDGKRLLELLASGKISSGQIDGARNEKLGTARINGPKEVVVKV